MVEHTIELEDIRARHVFPYDHLFTEALHASSSQLVFTCFVPSAHLLEFHRALLVRCPQNLDRCIPPIPLSPVHLSASPRCMSLVGDHHRIWVDPVGAREILTPARESRDCGEDPGTSVDIFGSKGIRRDNLQRGEESAWRETDPDSLTLSRHSITRTAVSPVKDKISALGASSSSASVSLLTSSSKLKSPAWSCSALGRESTISNICHGVKEGVRLGIVLQVIG